MNRLQRIAFIIVASATLAACGSTASKPATASGSVTPVDESVLALGVYEAAKANYEEWLAKLNAADGLAIYSNEVYQNTLDDWAEAVDVYNGFADNPAKATKDYSIFSSDTYAERFDEKLNIVKVKYNTLLALKERADTVLADSIDQMAYLNEIDAESYFKSEFNGINRVYKTLFEYVADKDLADAQNKQASFLNDAKKLEVKVVLHIHIEPLEGEIKLLNNQDVSLHAPISYAKAKSELALGKNAVQTNPRNNQVINEAVRKVKFEIAHATHIASEVQRLKSTKNNKFESLVLENENRLLDISKAMDGSDFRDKQFRVQSQLIIERLNSLSSKDAVASLEQQIANLQKSLDEAKSDLNQSERGLADSKQKQQLSLDRIDLLQQQLNLKEDQIARLEQSLANEAPTEVE